MSEDIELRAKALEQRMGPRGLAVYSVRLEDGIAFLRSKVAELEGKLRDSVPRSRYDVTCQQYNDLQTEMDRRGESARNVVNELGAKLAASEAKVSGLKEAGEALNTLLGQYGLSEGRARIVTARDRWIKALASTAPTAEPKPCPMCDDPRCDEKEEPAPDEERP